MTLCSFCQGINVNSIVIYIETDDDDLNRYSYSHQPSFLALVKSAKSCPLCDLILYAVEQRNTENNAPEAYKSHEDSHIWLVAGADPCLDLMLKQLFQLSVNVGGGDIILGADLGLAAHPSRLHQTSL